MTAKPFRVLVVGGAGVFGSRLVDAALATTDWEVVVAGRDAARTRAFAAARGARVSAVVLDARRCPLADLAQTGAHAVVDAAGPFQGAGYDLALAAVAAGLHYVDIADARDFVAGFAAAVGPAAMGAGVVALTGVSSTPALSNAALDAITAGWRQVDDVLVVISPGNRAPRGMSVMRAILSYAGRPVRVFHDGRWTEAAGWGLTRRVSLPGLGRRWASLCETPDLDILPARHRVGGSALFLAGLELPVLHFGLAAASLLVRFGAARSLAPLARVAQSVAWALIPFGTDRGGMLVEAVGVDSAGVPTIARFGLVASAGEGPSVPTLPALAALRALAEGRLSEAGARVCVSVLTLADIEAEFAGRRITTSRARADSLPHVFSGVLGAAFATLPTAVAALHIPGRMSKWHGRADVERGKTILARLVAWLFRFPDAGRDVPVSVTIETRDGQETWTRMFGAKTFRSHVRQGNAPGEVEERFGPFSFRLGLAADARGVTMRVLGWRTGPLVLPRAFAMRSDAGETEDAEGRFHFDVPIDLPFGLGRVVRYTGWLSAVLPLFGVPWAASRHASHAAAASTGTLSPNTHAATVASLATPIPAALAATPQAEAPTA